MSPSPWTNCAWWCAPWTAQPYPARGTPPSCSSSGGWPPAPPSPPASTCMTPRSPPSRAQAAMLPFYYGPLVAAVALAREARIIRRGRPAPRPPSPRPPKPAPSPSWEIGTEPRQHADWPRPRSSGAEPVARPTMMRSASPSGDSGFTRAEPLQPSARRAKHVAFRRRPFVCIPRGPASIRPPSVSKRPSASHMIAARRRPASWRPPRSCGSLQSTGRRSWKSGHERSSGRSPRARSPAAQRASCGGPSHPFGQM